MYTKRRNLKKLSNTSSSGKRREKDEDAKTFSQNKAMKGEGSFLSTQEGPFSVLLFCSFLRDFGVSR